MGGRRVGGVLFLTVWLMFWVVGESLVLWILIRGAWALLTGQPPGAGRAPLEAAPALGVGLFLLCWVSFWTLGGVVAGREWLRLLFGRDRLIVRPDGLEIERNFGLFRTRRTFPREKLLRFYRSSRSNAALMAETTGGAVEITQLGTEDDRATLETELNREFKFTPQATPQGVLPDGWCELTTPESTSVFTKDPVVRRKQASFLWIALLPFGLASLYLLNATLSQPGLGVILAIVGTLTAFIAWGAVRLARTRDEWELGAGRLALQRRVGQRIVRKFEATSLQLVETPDSDGDPWFRLVALASDAPETLLPSRMTKHQRVIFSNSGDPTDARNLGFWLARRCRIPFFDRTTATAKTQDMEELKKQLAASGRFGKWAVRLLDRRKTPIR